MTDGIIFDLDGTLWDATETVAVSWNRSIGTDMFTADDIAGIMGMTAREISDALFRRFGEHAYERCLKCLTDESRYMPVLGGKVYDGVRDMLKTLSARCPLFIVSNCAAGYIEAFLSFSGCGAYFTDHVCEGDNGLVKADNIRYIVRRYALRSPVYIGDTASDQESARAAGTAFIHAAYGFGTVPSPAPEAGSPAEIIDILGENHV